MDILSRLGIDLYAVGLQTVNFLLLLGILTYFLYRPILSAIDERKARIAAGEAAAQKAVTEHAAAQSQKQAELAAAHKEAKDIIDQAQKAAKAVEEGILLEAKQKAEKIIAEGTTQLALEREKAVSDLEHTLAELVTIATSKIIAKEVSAKERDAAIKEALATLA